MPNRDPVRSPPGVERHPYRPELNPQENVWQDLRQTYLSNRVFNTHTAPVGACCDAWNALVAQPGIMSTATRT